MKILYYEIGSEPKVKEISNDLSLMQEMIGGYVEVVPLGIHNAYICIDEDGRCKDLPVNRVVNTQKGEISVVGNFIVCKIEEDFCGFTDEEIEDILKSDCISASIKESFGLVVITTKNEVKVVPCDSYKVELETLKNLTGASYVNLVHINATDLMCVDDNGVAKDLDFNIIASFLRKEPILGDVVLGTLNTPLPYAEPDLYAFDIDKALHLKSYCKCLCEEIKKTGK